MAYPSPLLRTNFYVNKRKVSNKYNYTKFFLKKNSISNSKVECSCLCICCNCSKLKIAFLFHFIYNGENTTYTYSFVFFDTKGNEGAFLTYEWNETITTVTSLLTPSPSCPAFPSSYTQILDDFKFYSTY